MSQTALGQNKFLFITAGGTPDPVFKSVSYWKPKRILFICSKTSQKDLQEKMEEGNKLRSDGGQARSKPKSQFSEQSFKKAAGKKFPFLEEHNIGCLVLDDPEDIGKTLQNIREKAAPKHKEWIRNGENYLSIVDFTGGTKCMSASLALAARKWGKCAFSYVGGERDKGGAGIVKPGCEKIIHRQNPWEALGFQYMEEAVLLFKSYSYGAAYNVLDRAFQNMTEQSLFGKRTDQTLKDEFCAAKKWIKAYKDWDDFCHKESYQSLKLLQSKHWNNLTAAFKDFDEIDIKKSLPESLEYLEKILSGGAVAGGGIKNSPYLIYDLIINARRKAAQSRFDDAAARLYRAIEAMAQCRLQKHGIADSSKTPVSLLPGKLKKKLCRQKPEDSETCKLALRDSYLFLMEKADPLGEKFEELNLSAGGSPLAKRNQSVLAHGFEPLSEKNYKALLDPALELFKVLTKGMEGEKSFGFNKGENGRPCFPMLEKKPLVF